MQIIKSKNNELLILLLWIPAPRHIFWNHNVLYEKIIVHEREGEAEMTAQIFSLEPI